MRRLLNGCALFAIGGGASADLLLQGQLGLAVWTGLQIAGFVIGFLPNYLGVNHEFWR